MVLLRNIAFCCAMVAVVPAQSMSVTDGSNGEVREGSALEAVMLLQGAGSTCSGVPVSPVTVVTAAHCFDDGARVWVSSEQTDFLRTGTVTNHPDYTPLTISGTANDIAVVTLDADSLLPNNHNIFPVYLGAPFGATVEIGGYGLFGTGTTGTANSAGVAINQGSVGTLRGGLNRLDSHGASGSHSNLVSLDFDAPPFTEFQGNPYGSPPVSETIVTSKGSSVVYHEAFPASGDSGGPMLYNPFRSLQFETIPFGLPIKATPDVYFAVAVFSYQSDTSFEWATEKCTGNFIFTFLGAIGFCEVAVRHSEALYGTYGDNASYTLIAPYLDWIRSIDVLVGTTTFQKQVVVDPAPRIAEDIFSSNDTPTPAIPPPPDSVGECNGLPVTVDLSLGQTTTANDDVVMGTFGADEIRGKAGNDTICGMGGDDFIHGNSGDDWIDGGAGVDNIRGGQGNDVIYTGGGSTAGTASRVFGGAGDDVINGGSDDDDLRGGRGVDTINGNNGDDLLTGNDDNDFVNGGRGFDIVKGGSGDDKLFGGAGNDVVDGGAGNDVLNGGGDFSDFCNGGSGTDTASANCEAIANVP